MEFYSNTGDPVLERRRKLAEAMMTQGTQTTPVATPLAGLGRLAQALAGAYGVKRAEDQYRADQERDLGALEQYGSILADPQKPVSEAMATLKGASPRIRAMGLQQGAEYGLKTRSKMDEATAKRAEQYQKFTLDSLKDGKAPIFDETGNLAGFKPVQGYQDIVAAQEGAKAAARAYAENPALKERAQTKADIDVNAEWQKPKITEGAVVNPSMIPGLRPGQTGQGGVQALPGAAQPPAGGATPGVVPLPIQKPMTEQQGNSYLFGNRMVEAAKTIDQVMDTGWRPNLATEYGRDVPGANLVKGPQLQAIEQANRDFINASLRRESGAVISEAEFDNAYKQYLPRAGDSPEVLAQKKANRDRQAQLLLNTVPPRSMPQNAPVPANPAITNKVQDTGATAAQAVQSGPLDKARAAIAQGADKNKVIERLRAAGIDPAGL